MFNGVPEDVPDRATHKYAVALTKFELADYRGATGGTRRLACNQNSIPRALIC